tara:strand:+ start:177 stop:857 length:681 start_codon:yes stop_codon:yes gene_type:complete
LRNILARGGIEFIAVFLGIALSFYVEEWQTEKEQKELLKVDCNNILSDINEDLITMDRIISSNKKILETGEGIIDLLSDKEIEEVDTIVHKIFRLGYPTFFGITRSYKLSYSTGRLNLYANDDLIKEISKLYDHFYSRLDINSNIYDQVGLNFLEYYVYKHIGFTQTSDNYSKSEVLDFISDKLFVSHLYIFNSRVRTYLKRLNESKDQLLIVKTLIEKNYPQIKT